MKIKQPPPHQPPILYAKEKVPQAGPRDKEMKGKCFFSTLERKIEDLSGGGEMERIGEGGGVARQSVMKKEVVRKHRQMGGLTINVMHSLGKGQRLSGMHDTCRVGVRSPDIHGLST